MFWTVMEWGRKAMSKICDLTKHLRYNIEMIEMCDEKGFHWAIESEAKSALLNLIAIIIKAEQMEKGGETAVERMKNNPNIQGCKL
jgi:hypothetical protein